MVCFSQVSASCSFLDSDSNLTLGRNFSRLEKIDFASRIALASELPTAIAIAKGGTLPRLVNRGFFKTGVIVNPL